MFFVPDSGCEDGSLIEVAEKSILWMKVITHGKQCHASRPSLGINAFKAASDLVTRYQKLYKKFPKKDRLYEPPISTFEPTKKENNVPNVNTLPGRGRVLHGLPRNARVPALRRESRDAAAWPAKLEAKYA